jgi:tRNA G18 (ribose-2'-O)-methylase SpoU
MTHLVTIFHNIRSLHNVGSMFRTSDGAGVRKIFLTGITPQPIDRFGKIRVQFAKVSLGAEKTVPWEYERLIARVIKKLKAESFLVFALEQSRRSVPYNKIPKSKLRSKKICLVVGNEVAGLPQSILKLADAVLEIPMRGVMVRETHRSRRMREEKTLRQAQGKESLNVSVAFGIAAYRIVEY